jgi:CheY-like chemotaxis protein
VYDQRLKAGKPFTLTLMDIHLDGKLDGYAVTRELWKRYETARSHRPLPFIMGVSANAYREDVHRSLNAGMLAHLAKPFNRKQFLEKLAAMLQKRRADGSLPASGGT